MFLPWFPKEVAAHLDGFAARGDLDRATYRLLNPRTRTLQAGALRNAPNHFGTVYRELDVDDLLHVRRQ